MVIYIPDYDKRDDFSFAITNVPSFDRNISPAPAYAVCIYVCVRVSNMPVISFSYEVVLTMSIVAVSINILVFKSVFQKGFFDSSY